MKLLILPNQLFELKLKEIKNHNIDEIILYEHPHFFLDYKYNKLKLIFHRVTMKNYEKDIKNKYNNIKVKYVDYDEDISKIIKDKQIKMYFQPNKIKIGIESHVNIDLIKSPNFLCIDLFEEYRKKTDKCVFGNFYKWMKTKLNIIPKVSSKDMYNRKSIPKSEYKTVPYDTYYKNDLLKDAIKYVQDRFHKNPGPEDMDNIKFLVPFTRKDSIKALKLFIKERLNKFGKYQDCLYQDSHKNVVFHSCLSSVINIGLLNPKEVIDDIIDSNAPMNSKEGFIRQYFWREYELYTYIYVFNKKYESYFKCPNKLTKDWYTGNIGILPVDILIKKAFNLGYLHHTERLMIIGNFMLYNGIDPYEGFKWFMEFSLDSYEWVMYQNVFDSVYNITNKKTMKRMYICSTNYIKKMSNFEKGDWLDKWDKLYHDFIKHNKGKIGFPYEY